MDYGLIHLAVAHRLFKQAPKKKKTKKTKKPAAKKTKQPAAKKQTKSAAKKTKPAAKKTKDTSSDESTGTRVTVLGQWTCGRCTYINERNVTSSTACEMCGHRRPE